MTLSPYEQESARYWRARTIRETLDRLDYETDTQAPGWLTRHDRAERRLLADLLAMEDLLREP